MFARKDKEKSDTAAVMNEDAMKKREATEQQRINENLGQIDHKIVVLSGKGGVGKSTVAVNLAVLLSNKGFKVGLLDVDIHGPSVPKLLGIEDEQVYGGKDGRFIPVVYGDSLKVLSIGLLVGKGDDAVIWRGPLKYGAIKQFLKDVQWGELDYLIIDSPPGTGDEPLSVCQLLENPDGAIIVTTPQEVAILDSRKTVLFAQTLKMKVIGIIENMSGFVCPYCKKKIDLFKSGGGEKSAKELKVPFLGRIPIEPGIVASGDSGKPFINFMKDTETAGIMEKITNEIKLTLS